jgi:hypothetical protein
MFEDDENDGSFGDTVRSIARELGRSVERAADQIDLDEFADAVGIDPGVAKGWVDSAVSWLRAQTEGFGEEVALRVGGQAQTGADLERFSSAAPHPLDVPTAEQGLALAALDSRRWTIEPGTDALAVRGGGPGPSDALGLVRELRVRDWIAADGEITLAGRYALSRWLEVSTSG